MVDNDEAQRIKEEQGTIAALKFALSSGRDEVSEDLDDLSDDIDDLKSHFGEGEIEKVTCRACEREVNSFEVSRCEHCGYDASGHTKWKWIHALLAGLLCATLIGIPLAIIPILKARKHGTRASQGVVKVHRS